MKRSLVLFLSLFLCLTGVVPVNAITAIPRDFDQLVTRADTVFKGIVAAETTQWTGAGSTRHIVTFVTFQVEETYKGALSSEQTLRFLGGTVGDDTMEVPDMPQFKVGQKAVLFIVNNGKQFCPLVGIKQGRFHVIKDPSTGQERVFTDDGLPVVDTAELGKVDEAGVPLIRRSALSNSQAMGADEFKAAILGKVAALPR